MENIDILKQIIEKFQAYYKQMIVDSGHNASGQLGDTQSFEIDYSNNTWSITLKMADYWKYLEYGRRPGKMPPVDKILEWINVRKILPRNNKKLPQKSLAFAISKSIAKKGIPATHLLQKSMNSFDFKHKVLGSIFQVYKSQVENMIQNFGK